MAINVSLNVSVVGVCTISGVGGFFLYPSSFTLLFTTIKKEVWEGGHWDQGCPHPTRCDVSNMQLFPDSE